MMKRAREWESNPDEYARANKEGDRIYGTGTHKRKVTVHSKVLGSEVTGKVGRSVKYFNYKYKKLTNEQCVDINNIEIKKGKNDPEDIMWLINEHRELAQYHDQTMYEVLTASVAHEKMRILREEAYMRLLSFEQNGE